MSSRRLQDKSSRRLQDISSRRLEDMSSRCCEVVFRVKISSRRLEDVLEDEKVLCWRRRTEDQQMFAGLASNAISKFERKISGKGGARGGKRFALFILNEDMNDIL